METPLYNSMNAHTRKKFTQQRVRYKVIQPYKPHPALIKNMARIHHLTYEEAYRQLFKERHYLRWQLGLEPNPVAS